MLARGVWETSPVEHVSDEPTSAAGCVQKRTPSAGSGSGYLTDWGLKQETPKGDTAWLTHPTDGACGPLTSTMGGTKLNQVLNVSSPYSLNIFNPIPTALSPNLVKLETRLDAREAQIGFFSECV